MGQITWNDTTSVDLREPFQPIVYRAAAQERDPGTDLRVVLRSGLSLTGVRSAVTKIAARHSPEITLSCRAFPTMVRETLLRDRLMATLSGFFGVLAILLASIGLYGVMATWWPVAEARSASAWRSEPLGSVPPAEFEARYYEQAAVA
ncbi:MAG: hypothetical protein NUW22_12180 [Acidobacteria bacterium]|nr:hypothetical protein [Acidobacteriota bacterium]